MAQICRTLRAHPGPNRRRGRFSAATPALGGRGLTSAGPRVEAGPSPPTGRGTTRAACVGVVNVAQPVRGPGRTGWRARGGRGSARGRVPPRGAVPRHGPGRRASPRAVPRRPDGVRAALARPLPQRKGGKRGASGPDRTPAWSCAGSRQPEGQRHEPGRAREEGARPRASGRASAARSDRRKARERRGAPAARNKTPSGFFTGDPSASRPDGAAPARAHSSRSRPRAAPPAALADGTALPHRRERLARFILLVIHRRYKRAKTETFLNGACTGIKYSVPRT